MAASCRLEMLHARQTKSISPYKKMCYVRQVLQPLCCNLSNCLFATNLLMRSQKSGLLCSYNNSRCPDDKWYQSLCSTQLNGPPYMWLVRRLSACNIVAIHAVCLLELHTEQHWQPHRKLTPVRTEGAEVPAAAHSY